MKSFKKREIEDARGDLGDLRSYIKGVEERALVNKIARVVK